jgi:hypothetical protein
VSPPPAAPSVANVVVAASWGSVKALESLAGGNKAWGVGSMPVSTLANEQPVEQQEVQQNPTGQQPDQVMPKLDVPPNNDNWQHLFNVQQQAAQQQSQAVASDGAEGKAVDNEWQEVVEALRNSTQEQPQVLTLDTAVPAGDREGAAPAQQAGQVEQPQSATVVANAPAHVWTDPDYGELILPMNSAVAQQAKAQMVVPVNDAAAQQAQAQPAEAQPAQQPHQPSEAATNAETQQQQQGEGKVHVEPVPAPSQGQEDPLNLVATWDYGLPWSSEELLALGEGAVPQQQQQQRDVAQSHLTATAQGQGQQQQQSDVAQSHLTATAQGQEQQQQQGVGQGQPVTSGAGQIAQGLGPAASGDQQQSADHSQVPAAGQSQQQAAGGWGQAMGQGQAVGLGPHLTMGEVAQGQQGMSQQQHAAEGQQRAVEQPQLPLEQGQNLEQVQQQASQGQPISTTQLPEFDDISIDLFAEEY